MLSWIKRLFEEKKYINEKLLDLNEIKELKEEIQLKEEKKISEVLENFEEYNKEYNNKYNDYVGKEIYNWEVINYSKIEYNNKKIDVFDCRCKICERKIRISVDEIIDEDRKCLCYRIIENEWNKIKLLDIYKCKEDYIAEKRKNFEKKYYLKNPNGNISKDNLFFGTSEDVKQFYQNEINLEDANKCACCGRRRKNKRETCCDNCGMNYNERNNKEQLVKKSINCNFLKINECKNKVFANYEPSELLINYYNNNENLEVIYKKAETLNKYFVAYNDEIYMIGLIFIKEFMPTYIIGDFQIFSNKLEEIKIIHNIYFGMSFDSNIINQPMFFYKKDNKYKSAFNEEIININEVYETKLVALEKEGDRFNLNVYENDKLVLKEENVLEILGKNLNHLLIKKDERNYKILDIESNELFDLNIELENKKVFTFLDMFIDIKLDINSSKISDNLKLKIQENNNLKIDNKKEKVLYMNRNLSERNMVLYKYLEDLNKIKKVENEFDDDKIDNYVAIIDWNEKELIEFIEYIEYSEKIHYNENDYKYKIYDMPLELIACEILGKIKNKIMLCNFIKNQELFIIEDLEKRKMLINYILYKFPFNTIENNYIPLIVEKLCKKYNLNDFELLVLLIFKYGEREVFGFPSLINEEKEVSKYTTSTRLNVDFEQNEIKYNQILATIDINNIRWKSEFKLFKLIKQYFVDARYQYRFKELGLQSLDIYIPDFKIAFEYQGVQHYKPVEHFGGEEHFKIQVKNDKNKRKICEENDIILIEWRYDEKINKQMLDNKLENYREKLKGKYEFSFSEEKM